MPACGAEYQVRTVSEDYTDLWTNAALAAAYQANLERLGRIISATPDAVPGSTDMGNVSKLVPAIHPMIAIAPPRVALHTTEFAEYAASESGQRGVLDGAKVLAMTAIDVLCEAGLLEAMRAAFADQQSGAQRG